VEREVAQRVLRAGGTVAVLPGSGKRTVVSAVEGMPTEPFFVTEVAFDTPGGAGREVDDRMLDAFRDLAMLQVLGLRNAGISDEGLARFAASPGAANLVRLDLPGAPIGDAGLASLRNLRRLDALLLQGCTRVTDAGLKHLRDLPLRELHLLRTSVTG